MTGPVITGVGCLSPSTLAPGEHPAPDGGRDVTGLYPQVLPTPRAHVITDFDARRTGFKRAAFRTRGANLVLVACGLALDDSGLRVTDANRRRVGAVLGCGEGSLKAAGDYTMVTLTDPRPEHGSPALFPGTVVNHAAAQLAIHHGLSGPNTTVACGRMALLCVLRYSTAMLRGGHADTVLAGVVEEFSPYAAWLTHLTEPAGRQGVPAGEGAVVLVVESAAHARAEGRPVDAELLAVSTGFEPGTGSEARQLRQCVRQALAQAKLDPRQLARVVTDDEQLATVLDVPATATRVGLRHAVGECRAASGGLLLARLLALHRGNPEHDGQCSLLMSTDRDGGVGAAILRGWSRPARPGPDGGR